MDSSQLNPSNFQILKCNSISILSYSQYRKLVFFFVLPLKFVPFPRFINADSILGVTYQLPLKVLLQQVAQALLGGVFRSVWFGEHLNSSE